MASEEGGGGGGGSGSSERSGCGGGGESEELEDLDHLLRHDWVVVKRFDHVLQGDLKWSMTFLHA